MASLPAILTSHEELDALPEAVRDYYHEDAGRFVLALEGVPAGFASPADVQALIDNALKPERLAREAAEARADKAEFERIVRDRATKAGVRPASLRVVIRDAEDKFELKGGDIVPKAGVTHPSDPLKDLSPVEWLRALSKSDDYLFEPTVGGGAPNRPGNPGKAGARQLINPTPEEKGRHMDAIAKGEIVVVTQ